MKTIRLFIALFTILSTIGVFVLSIVNSRQSDTIQRLRANIETMNSDIRIYENCNRELIATANEQQYKASELRRLNTILTSEIESMEVKLKRVKSVTRVSQQQNMSVKLDTVYIPTLTQDTANCRPYALNYADAWTTANVVGDSLQLSIRDTIAIVRHNKERRFLFWRWNKHTNRVSVRNHNPHVTITSIESIEVE